MKLRIRGDSIRLRVSQSELMQIVATGSVSDSTRFGPAVSLTYRLEVGEPGGVAARLEPGLLTVTVPRSSVERWRAPTEVSISGAQSTGEGRQLSILIEKDFACLAPRDEDQSDLFPNPETRPC